MLLLLDTFDRLHDADKLVGPASAIGLAQRADPNLVVLVTSRARLGLRFEVVLPLTGLGLQPDGPAVQMFRERSKVSNNSSTRSCWSGGPPDSGWGGSSPPIDVSCAACTAPTTAAPRSADGRPAGNSNR